MIETKDLELLLGKMLSAQPLTDAETGRLEEWISQDYENLVMIENLRRSLEDAKTANGEVATALFDKIMAKEAKIRKHRRIRSVLIGGAVAACSVIAVLIVPSTNSREQVHNTPAGIILSDNTGYSMDIESLTESVRAADNIRIDRESGTIEFSSPTTTDQSVSMPEAKRFSIRVPYARELNVVLPDGTKVWINAGSEISFPEFFEGESRNVYLTGEAYFDVTHDESRHFIVHSHGIETRVYGTEFLMTAYPDDSRTSVSLVEGVLGVNFGEEQVMLKTGEGLEYDSEKRSLSRFTINRGNIELLKDGLFVFDNVELGTISSRLERWYGVQIGFAEETLAAMKFYIRIDKYDDIANVLELMKATNRIDYKYSDGEVWFSKPNNK